MIAMRKFQRNRQDYGLTVALLKASTYLFRWLYHARDYRIYRICLANWTPPACPEGLIQYRFIDTSDHEAIKWIESTEEWLRGEVSPCLQTGGLCLVASAGGKYAGFNLVGIGRVPVAALECSRSFRPGSAWSVQITVSPDFRGHGVASDLRYRNFVELKKRGITRFYGGTMTDNLVSLKLARKVGFQEVIDIHYRKYLGYRNWRLVRIRSRP